MCNRVYSLRLGRSITIQLKESGVLACSFIFDPKTQRLIDHVVHNPCSLPPLDYLDDPDLQALLHEGCVRIRRIRIRKGLYELDRFLRIPK
jgi:hypothetical protein